MKSFKDGLKEDRDREYWRINVHPKAQARYHTNVDCAASRFGFIHAMLEIFAGVGINL